MKTRCIFDFHFLLEEIVKADVQDSLSIDHVINISTNNAESNNTRQKGLWKFTKSLLSIVQYTWKLKIHTSESLDYLDENGITQLIK